MTVTECPLTPQQLAAVGLLADGLTYKQIAERMHIAASTVRVHLHEAYKRLGVGDRAQAVLICAKAGWIDVALSGSNSTPRLLRRVAESVESLVACIEARRRLSPWQREYLAAFDGMVRASTDRDRTLARRAMDTALEPVLSSVGISNGIARGLRGTSHPVTEHPRRHHKPRIQGRTRLGLSDEGFDPNADLARTYAAWERFWRGLGKHRRKRRTRRHP